MGIGPSATHNAPEQSVVPTDKTRICIAGITYSAPTGVSHNLSNKIAAAFPDKYETWFYWDGIRAFYRYTIDTFDKVPFPEDLKGHSTAPFVWLETAATGSEEADDPMKIGPNVITKLIGGNDRFCSWVLEQEELKSNDDVNAVATSLISFWREMNHTIKYGPQTAAVVE